VGKCCRINVLNTLTSRHHCANMLLGVRSFFTI
jgi:hypothetical protein